MLGVKRKGVRGSRVIEEVAVARDSQANALQQVSKSPSLLLYRDRVVEAASRLNCRHYSGMSD